MQKQNKNIKYIKILSFLLILLWMLCVYALSNQSSINSSKQSGHVIQIIINILPNTKFLTQVEKIKLITSMQHVIRKLAYFMLYTIGGISILNYAVFCDKIKKKVAFSIILGALYCVTDEIHQLFIPGRSCEIKDMLIDSSGVIFGMLIVLAIFKIINWRNVNEKKDVSNC